MNWSREFSEDFVERFESQRLTHVEWTHEAHLMVAAWYTMTYTPEDALQKLRRAIWLHNEAVGTANTDISGYHETLTRFWLNEVQKFWAKVNVQQLGNSM